MPNEHALFGVWMDDQTFAEGKMTLIEGNVKILGQIKTSLINQASIERRHRQLQAAGRAVVARRQHQREDALKKAH